MVRVSKYQSEDPLVKRGALFFRLIQLSVLPSFSVKSRIGMIPTKAGLDWTVWNPASFRWSLRVWPWEFRVTSWWTKELTVWWKAKFHTLFVSQFHSYVVRASECQSEHSGLNPGRAALCIFIWSSCTFFLLCWWKVEEFRDGMMPTRACLNQIGNVLCRPLVETNKLHVPVCGACACPSTTRFPCHWADVVVNSSNYLES